MNTFDFALPDYSQVFPVPAIALPPPYMGQVLKQLDMQMQVLAPMLDSLTRYMRQMAAMVTEVLRQIAEMVRRAVLYVPWAVLATTVPYTPEFVGSSRDPTPRPIPKAKVVPTRPTAITVNHFHFQQATPSTPWLTWTNFVGLVAVIGVIFTIVWAILTAPPGH